LKSAIESNNGYFFQIIGDAFCVAFHNAGDALKAAAKAQQDFQNCFILMLNRKTPLLRSSKMEWTTFFHPIV